MGSYIIMLNHGVFAGWPIINIINYNNNIIYNADRGPIRAPITRFPHWTALVCCIWYDLLPLIGARSEP